MSDYADAIAARIMDAEHIKDYQCPTGREVRQWLAQAAREGYALGYGAKS